MNKYIGKTLDGRYEIIEVIGVGGMSVVYKAMDNRLNRFVALKMLKEEYSTDNALIKQFHDESQSVAILSHPNIVSVYDVSRYEGTEYIVMELIEGITLKDYLQRRGALTWKEVTFFSIQIAKALEHAHSRNIIHRDIKPQNIMLLRDGTLKVADFGIARNMSNQGTKGIGEAIGSVHYVSPEQAKGSHIDSRSDIYSFGVVMYEMLAGRLPFEGDTPVSIAIQHINSMALPPSTFVSNIPKTLENITMKAMNPSLAYRYASASEILHDLECFRNDPNYTIKNNVRRPYEDPEKKDASADKTPRIMIKPAPSVVAKQMGINKQDDALPQSTHFVDRPTRSYTEKKGSSKDNDKDDREAEGDSGFGFSKAVLFALIAILLFLGGAIFFMVKVLNPFGSSASNKLTVPRLIGLNYNDVTGSLEYFDFNIQADEYHYDDEFEYGQIIDQKPAPNKSINKGGTITVTVSRGQKEFILPEYIGKNYLEVESELNRKGMVPIMQGVNSTKESNGTVISTDPAAGTKLVRGAEISVVYSIGPKPIEKSVVPDIKGKPEKVARNMITGASLRIGDVLKVESDEPEGTVVYQDTPPNSTVDAGTKISYHVSKGKPETSSSSSGNGTGTGGRSGFGMSIDPYPEDSTKRKIDFVLVFINDEDAISVTVKVNGAVEYTGTHYSSEGAITIPLTAYKGPNTVTVIQNNTVTYEELVDF